MKIEPMGKYEWWGVFLGEDDEEREFVVFADSMRHALDLDPVPGEIIELERVGPAGEGFELPAEVAEKLADQMKRRRH